MSGDDRIQGYIIMNIRINAGANINHCFDHF
jgi:hypothetical protein